MGLFALTVAAKAQAGSAANLQTRAQLMAKLSKDKGKRGEREVAELLRKYGFEARRGQQFKGTKDRPDVVHNMENFYIEVKRTQAFSLYPVLKKAGEECDEFEEPLIFHRRNGKAWVVVLDAEYFLELMAELTVRRI